jgi:hypothetical protein
LTRGAAHGQVPPVDIAYLTQFAVSAAAVALMIGLAAWATRGRGAPPLDEAAARTWLADEFPGRRLDGLWLAADGMGAVARSGEAAFLLTRMGDGYAARQVAWTQALAAAPKGGRIRIPLSDPAAPRAVLAMAAWPPKEIAA